ncbi:hypothetical protein Zmor_007990 [Zophobas morio]|uniref:Uncharacterized protein n=1 Tax=Zophobas morio TaxID=2755281 RepID=A0AA38ITW6_9CUCU|nr:hypothetical protein Zmor_007990 [Zophobas morio]
MDAGFAPECNYPKQMPEKEIFNKLAGTGHIWKPRKINYGFEDFNRAACAYRPANISFVQKNESKQVWKFVAEPQKIRIICNNKLKKLLQTKKSDSAFRRRWNYNRDKTTPMAQLVHIMDHWGCNTKTDRIKFKESLFQTI